MSFLYLFCVIASIILPSHIQAEQDSFARIYNPYSQNAPNATHPLSDIVAPQVALPIKIVISQQNSISAKRIYLSDIAKCIGFKSKCEESYGIDLGQAPAPGQVKKISKKQLEKLLKTELPGTIITVDSRPYITVKGEYIELDARTISNALKGVLKKIDPDLSTIKVELDRLQLIRPIRIRQASFEIDFPDITATNFTNTNWLMMKLKGPVTLDVVINYPDDKAYQSTFNVKANFSLYKLYPIARRDLRRGTVLAAADFTLGYLKLSPRANFYARSIKSLIGLRVRQLIKSGSAPRISQIERRDNIRRGQIVKLVITSGGLKISGPAKALGSGARGDVIPILYLATKRKFNGMIAGPSLIKVSL